MGDTNLLTIAVDTGLASTRGLQKGAGIRRGIGTAAAFRLLNCA